MARRRSGQLIELDVRLDRFWTFAVDVVAVDDCATLTNRRCALHTDDDVTYDVTNICSVIPGD